jgi:FtsH-binding integral membrane protein
MLASPFLVGVAASGPSWRHLPLVLFWFSGYFAFFATGLWLKASRRRRHLPPVLGHGAIAVVFGLSVMALDAPMIRWAPLFAVPLGVGLWCSAHSRERSLLSGLATAAGSALMTVVAYDAGAGTDWRRAWVLAAVQAAYFAGTVFYVKSMIRQRDDAGFRRTSIGFHAAALATLAAVVIWFDAAGDARPWGVSWAVVAVFAALTARAALVPRLDPPPRPARIGVGEIAATLAVAVSSLLA